MRHIKSIFITILFSGLIVNCAFAEEAAEQLEWTACVSEAKKTNPDLVSAWAKVKQAKASKEMARSATLPQITGNASELTSKGAVFGSTGQGGTNDVALGSTRNAKTTYDYNIAGQQLLFDGFKTSFNISTAERNIVASQYNYDVASSNIRLRLRTAYVNLLIAQDLLKIAKEIEIRRKESYDLVKLRYEGGREHIGSLKTSEADLAQASFDVDQARRSIYLAQRQLTKELGRKLFKPIEAEGDLLVKDTAYIRPDFDNLAETTPLLHQLIAQKEAAKFGVESAKAALFPQIYANATLGNTNVDAFPDKNEWSVGSSFTLNIFDGGNILANITKSKAAFLQAEADEKSGHDGVIYTLSNTWTTLQDTLGRLEVQRIALEAATERAKISKAQYAIGLLIYDNWIIIENNLVTAKKNFLSAERDALLAEANWIQAKGGTLDYD